MDAPTITLNGHTVTLERPRATAVLAMDRDINGTADGLWVGILTAALLECWPAKSKWPGVIRPQAWRVGRPIEDHGARVFDMLIEDGCDLGEVLASGKVAFEYAKACIFQVAEVRAAEGNSEALAAAG